MSRMFGPIRQCGIVVSSLDRALDYWTGTLGIGPFFRWDHVELDHYRYRGQPCELDLSVALANSGDMQIELIEQHNDVPSPYLDFLDRHGPGLQHYAVWSDDYDSEMSRLGEQGVTVLAEGQMGNGTRFAFFDGGDDAQPIMEIADLTPGSARVLQMIREAAVCWDGSNPVR